MESQSKLVSTHGFNSQHADIDKLVFLEGVINSTSSKMEVHCTQKHFNHVMTKKDFFDSKNVKELCRKGVPYKYFKSVILKLFNVENEDKSTFDVKVIKVFKDRDRSKLGDYIPYYSDHASFEENLPENYLTENGIKSVKEVQWLLCSVVPNIQHSPLILKLNYLFHLFLETHQVYFVLKNLLNMNYNCKDLYKIRWHMRFFQEDNQKLIQSVMVSFKELMDKSGKIGVEYLENELGFNTEELVYDMIFNLFIGYLRFEGVYRVFVLYLREGTKIFFRVCFALLRDISSYANLIKSKKKEDIIKAIKDECLKINDFDSLFEKALNFNLTRNNNKFIYQEAKPDSEKKDVQAYYLPSFITFPNCKKILSEESLLTMWKNLPVELRLKDLQMIYSSQIDGIGLKNVFNAGQKLLDKNLNGVESYVSLMVLETSEKHIFGCLTGRLIMPTIGKFETPEFTSLVTFFPEFKLYPANPNAIGEIIYIDSQSMLFGIGDKGPSFSLNADMSHGFSHESAAFNNPSLIDSKSGEYFIVNIEVYIFS